MVALRGMGALGFVDLFWPGVEDPDLVDDLALEVTSGNIISAV